MNIRTTTASLFALGLLASGALAQSAGTANSNFCPQDQRDRANYIDCIDNTQGVQTSTFGAAAIDPVSPGPVGEYVDETPAETNQRSGN